MRSECKGKVRYSLQCFALGTKQIYHTWVCSGTNTMAFHSRLRAKLCFHLSWCPQLKYQLPQSLICFAKCQTEAERLLTQAQSWHMACHGRMAPYNMDQHGIAQFVVWKSLKLHSLVSTLLRTCGNLSEPCGKLWYLPSRPSGPMRRAPGCDSATTWRVHAGLSRDVACGFQETMLTEMILQMISPRMLTLVH